MPVIAFPIRPGPSHDPVHTVIEPSTKALDGLSPDQAVALRAVLNLQGRVGVLVGPAGSGKTYLMKKVASEVHRLGRSVAYVAPTGKAAARLRDSVGATTRTIHSALYGAAQEEIKRDEKGNPVLDDKGNPKTTGKLLFGAPHAPCEAGQLLICDEASMCGAKLYGDLMAYLPPGATLLGVGDREQLEPVNDAWGFNFLNPTTALETVHRQALGSPIIRLATAIRRGEHFDWNHDGGEGLEARQGGIDEAVRWLAARRRAQVDATLITWTNRTRQALNAKVRGLLGYCDPVDVGEHLVCRANHHEAGTMNGEVVRVEAVKTVRLGVGDFPAILVNGRWFLIHPRLMGGDRSAFGAWLGDLKHAYSNKVAANKDARAVTEATGAEPETDPDDVFGFAGPRRWLIKLWLHVDRGQALTCHAAQGSQWTEVGFRRVQRLDTQGDEGSRLRETAQIHRSHEGGAGAEHLEGGVMVLERVLPQ